MDLEIQNVGIIKSTFQVLYDTHMEGTVKIDILKCGL